MNWINVLELCGEGGSITLQGRKNKNDTWSFKRLTNESAMADLLSEEDAEGFEFNSESEVVEGLESALEMLNERYPYWANLHPTELYPEFANSVIQHALSQKRCRKDIWEELLPETNSISTTPIATVEQTVAINKGLKLQNKVDPWGNLSVASEHGAWLGNRGILHNDQKQIVKPSKPWQHNCWITCLPKFTKKDNTNIRRELFSEGRYSELFILDEATAFAAGHRPCGECRNKRYKEFKSAWFAANSDVVSSESPQSQEMDKILQKQRAIPGGGKQTYKASIESLPAGTMIELDGAAFLIWRDNLYRWSFAGYSLDDKKVPATSIVQVLTPESIVRTFASGFIPEVHVTAFR